MAFCFRKEDRRPITSPEKAVKTTQKRVKIIDPSMTVEDVMRMTSNADRNLATSIEGSLDGITHRSSRPIDPSDQILAISVDNMI